MRVTELKYFQTTFRALSSRNFRLFLTGQGISLFGTCLQQTALGWLVYSMTCSSAFLGIVGFCGQIPSFFLAPLAGALADRYCKRKLIILTQILSMFQAATLGTLLITGSIRVWHIPVLSLVLGIVNAFDIPARQSFIIETVGEKPLLGNALSLNSSMVNMTRIIGPPLAGILIVLIGEGSCFYVNAVSFGAVIFSMVLMKNIKPHIRKDGEHVLKSLKDGFNYAFSSVEIRSILIQLGLVSLAGVPFVILLPVFAKDILHGGSQTLGFLMGASGAGALTGALFLASRKNDRELEKIKSLGVILLGLGLIGFSRSEIFLLSLFMLFLSGFGMMVQMAASNTLLQHLVDDDKRGRIMSLFTMAFMGMIPLGSLLHGSLANRIGAPETLTVGGLCCIFFACVFMMKNRRNMDNPMNNIIRK